MYSDKFYFLILVCKISKQEKPRGHKVVAVMSPKFDRHLLSSSQYGGERQIYATLHVQLCELVHLQLCDFVHV